MWIERKRLRNEMRRKRMEMGLKEDGYSRKRKRGKEREMTMEKMMSGEEVERK